MRLHLGGSVTLEAEQVASDGELSLYKDTRVLNHKF